MKHSSLTLLLSITVACTNVQSKSLDSFIGLYEIVNAKCEIDEGAYDPCKGTLFFEILKGQFYGIGDDDLAYVFWSGDSKVGGELTYESSKISEESAISSEGKFWLNKDEGSEEYLSFFDGEITEYHLQYKVGDEARTISYELRPVRRGNKPYYRMNYPGNPE